ncbi:hypothetical protein NX801_03700 [Streptomyces sp. LP05-1]|uniref:Uncharacterized protein n=1 Tax=Streptomyces pyxinae TaxID=2970734 RepID=A0ABT2CBJ4_9ACTN|nr:hypothetical protein [Streptomyces sp. LP05-1]MCS0634775.1 hypothetical protein [Streptomyces sp. LP05-1]
MSFLSFGTMSPRAPEGTVGHKYSPAQLKVGDLVFVDNVPFAIINMMASGRDPAQRVLWFDYLPPVTVAGSIWAYRRKPEPARTEPPKPSADSAVRVYRRTTTSSS